MHNKDITEVLDTISLDTWIVSDTHLGHKNILEFEPCRLTQMRIDGYDADEHDKWVVDKWNEKVKPGDTVLHLGDFAFKGVNEYIKQLNGNIVFVLGNHDDKPKAHKWWGSKVVDGFYFYHDKEVCKVMDVKDPMFSGFVKTLGNIKILFSHYPVYDNDEWDRKNQKIAPRVKVFETIYSAHQCELNIHGHIHSGKSDFKNSRNASFENINFGPIPIKEIISKVDIFFERV